MSWFATSKDGLEKIARRRGLTYVLYELVSNAWDTGATEVQVSFEPEPNRSRVWMRVEDDDPDGFHDITHAFTLFAESLKKADPTKRGKFNLGEKLVLAVCEEAEIVSTKASVSFSSDGERKTGRRRREKGSLFQGLVKMNRDELHEVLAAAKLLIPPANVSTTINGDPLRSRTPLANFEVQLPTEVADDLGFLKTRERKTCVEVYAPLPGEPGRIFEMGIPVCETGDPWDVNIFQKVPVNLERNSVTPAYLKAVRVHVFNAMHEHITESEATTAAALSVLGDSRVDQATVERVIREQYGENVAFEDPKDPEAENRLKARGFTILKRRAFSPEVRTNLDRFSVVQKAGEISPTPKPYSSDPDAKLRELVPEEAWTDGMRNIANYCIELGERLVGRRITVVFDKARRGFSAAYGEGELTFFLGSLGRPFFDFGPTDELNQLLIHELAHEMESNHLSSEFYKALQSLGARMVGLALREPEFFKRFGWRDRSSV